jgi:hypothetical protein
MFIFLLFQVFLPVLYIRLINVYFSIVSGLLTSTLHTFEVSACDGETLKIKCPLNTMISIQLSQYGRQAPSYQQCPVERNDDIWEPENTNCLATTSLRVCIYLKGISVMSKISIMQRIYQLNRSFLYDIPQNKILRGFLFVIKLSKHLSWSNLLFFKSIFQVNMAENMDLFCYIRIKFFVDWWYW